MKLPRLAAGHPLARAADALLGLGAISAAEVAVVLTAHRAELAGPWELRDAIRNVLPATALANAPWALAGAIALGACERAALGGRAARATLAAMALGAAALVGVGVTTGRHFAAWPVRAAFVGALALVAASATFAVAPRVGALARARPRLAAALAAIAVAALELANARVLPRLYPAMHAGLGALAAAAAPFVALAWRDDAAVLARATVALALFAFEASRLPRWAPKLALDDNLRWIFLSHAPLGARGVELAAAVAPPPPLEPAATVDAPRESAARALDLRGRDVFLLTIDALRADHVGAYGYARATTPNIDALAREGVVFDDAYAPTPHTSYSVTSLMTGKAMRPLVLQGLGAGSDTLAGLARKYGYRTAAFYPPAVFFIDGERFAELRDRGLDFEYRRVEFATPAARAEKLAAWLDRRPPSRGVLAWVHLFEPHEPYEAHPEHPFGDRDVNRYDAEIAAADDGIGALVRVIRARRPGAVIVVTADHGEEFGDHGGRYHGTTVFEEQVRVPLVVVAPGLVAPHRVTVPVQTIDVMPTLLAALDVPRPLRVRGRDLGPWLAGAGAGREGDRGFAYAETDEQTLLAEGPLRLVCERRAGACALFDVKDDRAETRDVAASHADEVRAMKRAAAAWAAAQGSAETAGLRAEGHAWPDALRRGIAGDGDAAPEVASLLDDADPVFRREAAAVLLELARPESASALSLALARDDDDEVRRYAALALTRLGHGVARARELLADKEPRWSRLAALAFAEAGDARGAAILAAWLGADDVPFEKARRIAVALGELRAKDGVPALVRALVDVRLRPFAATALGKIGDEDARPALAARFAAERFANARVAMGEALAALGAKKELAPPLVRWLGVPDPLPNGLAIAERAGVLDEVGGPSALERARSLPAEGDGGIRLNVPAGGNGAGLRVVLATHAPADGPRGVALQLLGATRAVDAPVGEHEWFVDWPGVRAPGNRKVTVAWHAARSVHVRAVAVVPLADELPPPAPEPWRGPVGDDANPPETEASPAN